MDSKELSKKEWLRDIKSCVFPKMDYAIFNINGSYDISFKTHIRFQREGIWYRRISIHSFKLYIEPTVKEMFDMMQKFIDKTYEIVIWDNVNTDTSSDWYEKPDESQISERNRLEILNPHLKEMYK